MTGSNTLFIPVGLSCLLGDRHHPNREMGPHLLVGHALDEGPALLMDLPAGSMEVLQELQEVLGGAVRLHAGLAADGGAGGLPLLALCGREEQQRGIWTFSSPVLA